MNMREPHPERSEPHRISSLLSDLGGRLRHGDLMNITHVFPDHGREVRNLLDGSMGSGEQPEDFQVMPGTKERTLRIEGTTYTTIVRATESLPACQHCKSTHSCS